MPKWVAEMVAPDMAGMHQFTIKVEGSHRPGMSASVRTTQAGADQIVRLLQAQSDEHDRQTRILVQEHNSEMSQANKDYRLR